MPTNHDDLVARAEAQADMARRLIDLIEECARRVAQCEERGEPRDKVDVFRGKLVAQLALLFGLKPPRGETWRGRAWPDSARPG